MKIIYTIHALERIKSRKISLKIISKCIENPDRIIKEDNMSKNTMKVNDKVLVVAFRKKNNIIIVITAYTYSKVEKYLNP